MQGHLSFASTSTDEFKTALLLPENVMNIFNETGMWSVLIEQE